MENWDRAIADLEEAIRRDPRLKEVAGAVARCRSRRDAKQATGEADADGVLESMLE